MPYNYREQGWSWPTSEELRAERREAQGSVTLLSFSCGKDSIAAWLALRDSGFERIVPYYLVTTPGLPIVERSLAYYEDYFQTRIIRVPHPSLYRYLVNGVYQPLHLIDAVLEAGIEEFDYVELEDYIREDLGLDCTIYTATGVRAPDSLDRRSAIKKRGPIVESARKWYPVYDWTNDDLRSEFKRHGVKLPPEYALYGRSLDGYGGQYMTPLRLRYPSQYALVKEWYPLVGAGVIRDRIMSSGSIHPPPGEEGLPL